LGCAIAPLCAPALGCKKPDPGADLQILDASARLRSDEPLPRSSPYFDGTRVALALARGEVLGLEVWHRDGAPVTLTIDGARVEAFATVAYRVVRPSTALYGGSRGAGRYPDGLVAAAAPTSDPAYLAITAEGTPGDHAGTLTIGARAIPVTLAIAPVVLPPPPIAAWAYYDAHELGGVDEAPSDRERACIAMFRARGVLLSPDLPVAAWPARRALLAGSPLVPAVVADDPARIGDDVRAWIAATDGTGQLPFAIPIDEPHDARARERVRALGEAAHAAGAGPSRFLFAVTDDPRPEYAGAVDLLITLHARLADDGTRWTYNGAPPRAGAMVLDAEPPGMRTWGWIAYRYKIPLWYVWDALYWHDRHHHKTAALDPARDAVSFDDGDDRGNLDGVLALPGDAVTPCLPTLRLEALRRGLEDRQLLELAARCDRAATDAIAERMVPRALGDATAEPAWPSDPAAWEAARRELLAIATRCAATAPSP